MAVRKKLGDVLVDAGLLQRDQLEAALARQQQSGGRLGRILIDHGIVDERRLTKALSQQLNVPTVDLDTAQIHDVVRDEVPREMAEKLNLMPVGIRRDDSGNTLYVAMSDPTNIDAIDTLQFRTGKKVSPMIAGEQEIDRAIRKHYYGERTRSTTPPPMSAVQFSGNDLELEPGPEEIPVVTGTVLEHLPAPAPSPDALFGPVGSFLGADDDGDPSGDPLSPPPSSAPPSSAPPSSAPPSSAPPSSAPPSSAPPSSAPSSSAPSSSAPLSNAPPSAAPPSAQAWPSDPVSLPPVVQGEVRDLEPYSPPPQDQTQPYALNPFRLDPAAPASSAPAPLPTVSRSGGPTVPSPKNPPSHRNPPAESLNPFASPPPTGPGGSAPIVAAPPPPADLTPTAPGALPIEQVELHAPPPPVKEQGPTWADAVGEDAFDLSGPSPIAPPKHSGLSALDPFADAPEALANFGAPSTTPAAGSEDAGGEASPPIEINAPPATPQAECDHCGKTIVAVARFCPNCGQQRLPVPGAVAASAPSGETLDLTDAIELTEVPAASLAPKSSPEQDDAPAADLPSSTAPLFPTATIAPAPESETPVEESVASAATTDEDSPLAPPLHSEKAEAQAAYADRSVARAPSSTTPSDSASLPATSDSGQANDGAEASQSNVLAPPAGVVDDNSHAMADSPPTQSTLGPESAPQTPVVDAASHAEQRELAPASTALDEAEELEELEDLTSEIEPAFDLDELPPTAVEAAATTPIAAPTETVPLPPNDTSGTRQAASPPAAPAEDMSDIREELVSHVSPLASAPEAAVPSDEQQSAFEEIHAPSFANPRTMVPIEEWGRSAGDVGPDASEDAAPLGSAKTSPDAAGAALPPPPPPVASPPPPAMQPSFAPPPPPPPPGDGAAAPKAIAKTARNIVLSTFPERDDAKLVDAFGDERPAPTSDAALADDVRTWDALHEAPVLFPFALPSLANAADVDTVSSLVDANRPDWHDVHPAIIDAFASEAAAADDPAQWATATSGPSTASANAGLPPPPPPPPSEPPSPPRLADTWRDAAEKPLYDKRTDVDAVRPERRKRFEVSEPMATAPAPTVEPKVSYTPLSVPSQPNLSLPAGGAAPWAAVPVGPSADPPEEELPTPPAVDAIVDPPPQNEVAPTDASPPPAEAFGVENPLLASTPPAIDDDDSGAPMMPPPFSSFSSDIPTPTSADLLDAFDAPDLEPPPPPVGEPPPAAESNPYKGPSPTMITKMNPAELRKLAERLVQKGALTEDDYQAAKGTNAGADDDKGD